MNTFIRIKVTHIYTVSIDDDSLTEKEKVLMAVERAFDEYDKYDFHPNCVDAECCDPNKINDMEMSTYIPLVLDPKDYIDLVQY